MEQELFTGTISVTVGAGGNGGAGTYSAGASPNNGNAGANGGTSTFMDLQATGGQGGQVRGYGSNQVWEGAGPDELLVHMAVMVVLDLQRAVSL